MDRLNRNPEETAAGSLALRFTQGAFWSFAGLLGSRLAGFLGAVIAARFLGQSGFGELAIIQSTIALMGSFAGYSIGLTAVKYVAELKGKNPERTGRIIPLTCLVCWIAGVSITLIFLWAAPWLAATSLNAPHLTPELRLSSLMLLVSVAMAPQNGMLIGFQAFQASARISWSVGLVSLPLTALLAWLAGVKGVIVATILSLLMDGLLSLAVLIRECRRHGIHLRFREAWQERAILWRFSLPAFLASINLAVVTWAAKAILANQSRGYAELGLFSAAMQFQWLITALNTILVSVSVPLLTEIYGREEKEPFARAYNLYFKLHWRLAAAAGFLALGLSPWLIRLFGDRFQNGSPVLALCLAAMVMGVVFNLADQSFFISGRMWLSLTFNLVWGIILLAVVVRLVPPHGASGLAVAFTISYSLVLILELTIMGIIFSKTAIKEIVSPAVYSIILIICGLWVANFTTNFFVHIALIALSLIMIVLTIRNDLDIFKSLWFYCYLFLRDKIETIYTARNYPR